MDKMIEMGHALVFPFDIVAIEKGKWDDKFQDWYAILVTTGGGRISCEVVVQTAREKLESARAAQKAACRERI